MLSKPLSFDGGCYGNASMMRRVLTQTEHMPCGNHSKKGDVHYLPDTDYKLGDR